MNVTSQFKSAEATNDDIEYKKPEWVHYSYIRDDLIMFLIGGIGVSLVSMIGMIGNALCAIVLSRPSMRASTNIILLGLSVYDFLFVLMNLLYWGLPRFIRYFCLDSYESFYWTTLFPIMFTYFIPLIVIAQFGSTYMTVLVSMERCFVVYRPLLARPYCTNTNAVRASLVTVLFTILYTLPCWWHYRLESVYDESGSWTKYRILKSLVKNQTYSYFSTGLSMLVYRIIPITLLTLLNISIYRKVREANKMRESMTQLVTSSDISLAKMLMWVVSIFLMCNLWNLYMALRGIVGSGIYPEHYAVGFFLFSLNCSVNFIIYCVMTKKFRRVFLELFRLKKSRERRSDNVQMGPM